MCITHIPIKISEKFTIVFISDTLCDNLVDLELGKYLYNVCILPNLLNYLILEDHYSNCSHIALNLTIAPPKWGNKDLYIGLPSAINLLNIHDIKKNEPSNEIVRSKLPLIRLAIVLYIAANSTFLNIALYHYCTKNPNIIRL